VRRLTPEAQDEPTHRRKPWTPFFQRLHGVHLACAEQRARLTEQRGGDLGRHVSREPFIARPDDRLWAAERVEVSRYGRDVRRGSETDIAVGAKQHESIRRDVVRPSGVSLPVDEDGR